MAANYFLVLQQSTCMLHIYNKNLHVLSYMGVAELSELVKISHI